jgi:acylglycerol lipase
MRATVPLNATAPSIQRDEDTFAGAQGVRLFERRWTPPGQARAAFVLVHGIKDHSGRYEELANALAQQGVAVRAFDLRGHGKSEGKRVAIRSFDEYLEDLDLAVARARKAHPEKPLFLFGHSMGGAIATLYTIARRPDLAGLVLSAPALKPGGHISPSLIRITKALGVLLPGLRVFKPTNEMYSRDPAVAAGMAADPLVFQTPGSARLAAQLLKAMERIEAHMGEVSVPLLVLHGTGDRLTDPDGSRQLVARAASTDKTLKIFEGSHHDLAHEPEHGQFVRDIVDWVGARAR